MPLLTKAQLRGASDKALRDTLGALEKARETRSISVKLMTLRRQFEAAAAKEGVGFADVAATRLPRGTPRRGVRRTGQRVAQD